MKPKPRQTKPRGGSQIRRTAFALLTGVGSRDTEEDVREQFGHGGFIFGLLFAQRGHRKAEFMFSARACTRR